MSTTVRSYLCKLLVGLAIIAGTHKANAQEIFLDPDTVFVTTGAGNEIDFDLRVDENTQGIRLFQTIIAFDTSKADTVSTALGPLFESAPYTNVFNSYVYFDSNYGTTVLQIEGLLFGATAIVDGPGIVAEFRIVTKGSGTLELEILEHVMTDINNDPISSTAAGAVVYINQPPASFNLISPTEDDTLAVLPGDSLGLVWESSQSVYPGEAVEYKLELSKTSSFSFGSVSTFFGLSDTVHYVDEASLELDRNYWYRVTAIGEDNNFTTESTPFSRRFYLAANPPPAAFDLLAPVHLGYTDVYGRSIITFDWEDATSGLSNDTLWYTVTVATAPDFAPPSVVFQDSIMDVSQYDVPTASLPLPETVFWKVLARNRTGQTTPSTSDFETFCFMRGDMTPAYGVVDPIDLSFLVDYIFAGGMAPYLDLAGDYNCDLTLNPVDLAGFVDYFFAGGAPPFCP